MGYEISTESANLQYQAIKDQTGAMSVITTGLQGLNTGLQFGANLTTFGQQYWGWGQNNPIQYNRDYAFGVPGGYH
jgi:hypothetical protein